MNDEIREIFEEHLDSIVGYPFQKKDKEYILDYITNLQKEDYKSRVEKALEYINKNKKVVSKYEAKDTRLPLDTFMWGVDNLLNILQNGSESQ